MVTKTLLTILVILILASGVARQDTSPPIYVTLWFDTEDYILPQDDEATKLAGCVEPHARAA